MTPNTLHEKPEYFEIAFSFRDVNREVETLAELARRFGDKPVARLLEIGCGTAPHLEAIARQGWEYVGVDNDPAMLSRVEEKAKALGTAAKGLKADMTGFDLAAPVDMAVAFIGSLYVASNEQLNSHFDAMGRALRPGGLYVLDRCIDMMPGVDITEDWEEERDGIHVRFNYTALNVNRAAQTYEEWLRIEVNDHGATGTFEKRALRRAIYPQEFLLYIGQRPDFEFVGWWDDWDLNRPIEEAGPNPRPLALLMRI